MDQARVTVAPRAADALARGTVGLVEEDAARRVEGMVAAGGQGIGDFLDAGEMYFPSTKTAPGFQLSISRGRKSPRSSSSIRLPDGASVWASVPPPAPLPTIITS